MIFLRIFNSFYFNHPQNDIPLSAINETDLKSVDNDQTSLSSPIDSASISSGISSEQSETEIDLPVESLTLLNDSDASELEAFDMMIQSAGPFQHPRVPAQPYGHGHPSGHHGAAHHAAAAAANTFRHQSYHQVSFYYFMFCKFRTTTKGKIIVT